MAVNSTSSFSVLRACSFLLYIFRGIIQLFQCISVYGNFGTSVLYSGHLLISGESFKDVTGLTGKDPNDIDTVRLIMHESIILSNTVCAPKGQRLDEGKGSSLLLNLNRWS